MRTRLCTALSACLAITALAAQRPDPDPNPQQPTFRGGANYVRVDMYATQDGVPIGDLKPDEIELREDGVVQKIETFEHVVVQPSPEASRVEPSTVAESRQMAAASRARVFVIFLDTLHTQIEGSANMRLPLVRFLDQTLGKDDMVAVMTPEMSARDLTFGRKTTVISNIMQTQWDWGRRGRDVSQDPRERQYDACYPPENPRSKASPSPAPEMKARRREKLTFDALEDLVTVLAGLREERKAVLTVSEGWLQYKDNQSLAAAIKDDDGHPNVPPPDIFGRAPRPRAPKANGEHDAVDYAQCEVDRMALAQMDNRTRLREITDQANRGNISFYTIYPRGLAVFDAPIGPDKPPSPIADRGNLSTRQDSLRFLADSTDGISIVSTNQIEKGIDRILSDLSSYYLLSYYSTNTKLDGRFRSISVKASRPGAMIRARRGYRGPTAEQMLSTRSSTSTSAAPLSTAVVDSKASFRIRASTWVPPASAAAAVARLWIVGEVDYRARRELAWSSGAQAEVTVVGADGAQVLSTTVDMPATDGTFSLRVPESGGLAPGEYAVRVRVKPAADPSLPVSDVARVQVGAKPSMIGEAVLWRRGPTTGLKYLMTADPRFMRTERLRLELPTRATMPASARLLERSGKAMNIPVQVSERDDAGSDFRWIVVEAALAPLAAGDYALEVTVDDSRQVTPFKIVP